ncbi:MAG TPA: serine hydrolase [Chitinophagaceae bacterium]|nr:serine hydrolase [Chitinophagaceae bacterium]
MKKLFLLFFLVPAMLAFAQKKGTPDKRFDGLDAAFNQVLKDWHAAGFAVAVVEKNKIIYQNGFGYRDVEKGLPVTPTTLFAIGSCTKAFTASLMGLLQRENKVDFDKPAHLYLPALSFYNDAMNNSITLRDMMSHRTGLPRHDASWYFFNTASRDSIIQRIHYQEPNAGVRDKWQYNNFMFTAQGAIAEKLTAKTWEENIKEIFFTPLGMTASDFSVVDMQKNVDAALGYRVKNDSVIKKLPYYNINAMGPAGSINSNVTDMAAWVTTWINGGKYKGAEIIPPAYVTEAMTAQAIVGGGLPSKEKPDVFFSTYGFGWFLSSYRGHYRVEHGGNIDGFSASTAFFPTDSIGIVVLCNQDGSSVPSIVRNMLSDRLLKLPPYNWSADLKTARDKAKAAEGEAKKTRTAATKKDTKPTHALKEYEGQYMQPGYGTIHVFQRNDSLFARTADHTMWLRHDNFDVFDYFEVLPGEDIDTSESGPSRMQFALSKTGDIESLAVDLEASLKPLVFSKQLPQKEVTKEDLQKYTGDYSLGGQTVKLYIKNEKTLYLFVPGQPEYELVPMEGDKFGIKVLPGYFVQFTVNDKGLVTDATFQQPNGNFKATKKQ